MECATYGILLINRHKQNAIYLFIYFYNRELKET